MIVVDTSVWVDVMRKPTSDRAETFRKLLDADEVALPLPVRVELLSGVARKNREPLMRGLSALPLLRPSDDTWHLIEGWLERASDAGCHFAVTDLLIAGVAHELGALVWSLDADFAHMEKLGLVRRYE